MIVFDQLASKKIQIPLPSASKLQSFFSLLQFLKGREGGERDPLKTKRVRVFFRGMSTKTFAGHPPGN